MFTHATKALSIVVAAAVITACSGSENPQSSAGLYPDNPPKAQTQKETPSPSPQPDSFGEAVSTAMSAADLAHEAKSELAWKGVTSTWERAIGLMKTVPPSSAHYALAQKKVSEYQKNLAYAAGKLKRYTERDKREMQASHGKLLNYLRQKYGQKPKISTWQGKKALIVPVSAWDKLSEAQMFLLTDYAQSNGVKVIVAGNRIVWGG